jgi:TolB-like protein/class 3 adenylate cyclase/thioredoxin-like negative regulator of GroEL
MERRLAAILAADVVGYSRLIEADEAGTLAAVKSHREALIEPKIGQHHGRIVKLMGDGLLAEFPSAVEAVQCAVEIQHIMAERNADEPTDRRTTYRVGINIGDIVVEEDDIFGDGVNIAARLEGLAEPGGVCISRPVYTQIKGKLNLTFEHLGEKKVKNITEPVTVYRVALDDKAAALVTPVMQGVAKSKRPWWPLGAAAVGALLLTLGGVLWWQPWKPDVEPALLEAMAFPLPDKPSIAVLPFANMGGDPEQDYFADGMTDDLITDLSKISGLFVIARNSSFAYKGQQVKVRQVAEELGVRYVLEGSVRRAGNEVRINAQLIDATTGGHLWADRYDRDYADIFDLQDEVIGRIVSALAVQLTDVEQHQVARKPTGNLEAYEAFQKAEQGYYSYNFRRIGPGLGFYQQAIDLDPNFAEAHAGYARATIEYLSEFEAYKFFDADEARRRAYDSITRALSLNADLSRAHSVLGLLHTLDENFDEAVMSARKAVSLDPNSAQAFTDLALVLIHAGRPTEAIPAMETALRLEPNPPHYYLYVWGRVLFMNGQYERALEVLEKVRQEQGRSYVGGVRLFLAMTLAELGRLEEARKAARIYFLEREFGNWGNVTYLRHVWAHYKRKEDLERLLNALRQAGFPEWPFGYHDPGWERLDGAAIEELVYGHTWFGRSQNKYETFTLSADEQGGVRYFQFGRFWDGAVSVEEDRLCYQIPALLVSRKFCGPVYRNPGGTPEERNEYVAVDVYDVHHFSLKE